MSKLAKLSLITLLLNTTPAYAEWFQASGSSFIDSSGKKIAKTRATENALKKALLVAGASVSSVQQVVNGLMTKDELNVRASGVVNGFEIVEEYYQDDVVTVTIRADIFPQEKQCFAADYQKRLLVTKAHIKYREQANIGGIYQLDRQIAYQLNEQLQNNTRYMQTQLALNNTTEFGRYIDSFNQDKLKDLTISIANMTQSQFILYTEITDLSFEQEPTNSWKFWQNDILPRNFAIRIHLFDGNTGESFLEQQYSAASPWTYKYREQVDVASNQFQTSPYGLGINRILEQAVMDLDESLMCQPSQAKIIHAGNNQLILNIGKRHGVQIGDEFSLLHQENFIANNGKQYTGYTLSPYKVTITKVTQDSATAVTQNDETLGNIQHNDLAVRY
ncbi:flagellar assembly protein T N-terminal domain-containing protein [Thalassotalea sp. LPB0316]|uniref:flagella assembly protein FlgT n=1 Tax=Thalassotalea sp. LPB0316 TaxID=2769490 RepID=UPI001865C4BF|nr:flagella assembly protein FlgT [Thalassotalea sp. LPB0316]QOL25352.1 flagellar assembly protein T N-terminal domain-containing protein [Thalassotalea sp. LPB0316]